MGSKRHYSIPGRENTYIDYLQKIHTYFFTRATKALHRLNISQRNAAPVIYLITYHEPAVGVGDLLRLLPPPHAQRLKRRLVESLALFYLSVQLPQSGVFLCLRSDIHSCVVGVSHALGSVRYVDPHRFDSQGSAFDVWRANQQQ